MSAVAFFDLDKTLLSINSARAWFRRERAEGRIGMRKAIEAAGWMGLYGLGLMDGPLALGRAAATVAGQSEADMMERIERFFVDEVKPKYSPGGVRAVREHQDRGEPVVLLTSATKYLADLVAADLGLDGSIAMELGVADGLFTGEVARICYGPAKVPAAESWAEGRDVDFATSWFYSDSVTDLPMLEHVGLPRIVSPDPRLARLARKRGWPVLDWS